MKKLIIIITSVFVSINSNAQYTLLHSFGDTITDGNNPKSNLLYDGTFLYGMTSSGGADSAGTIFKIKPDGTAYLKLFDFVDTATGMGPQGSLISDGLFLYGMTFGGGANGYGTIFKIMPDGTGFLKLLDFAGTTNGRFPVGSLLYQDSTLFGMTQQGGLNDLGTIFKIKPDGTNYVKLLDMAGTLYGRTPDGSLISDSTFLYGMTYQGGANGSVGVGFGTVFKIKKDGTGYTDLLDFDDTISGKYPYGSLFFDGTFLYGMNYEGGANNSGTIFKIKTDGTSYTKLLDFSYYLTGANPAGSLIFDGTFLYGTCAAGGANNNGTIFKIKTDGTGFAKLFDFLWFPTGSNPFMGQLVSDSIYFYGMTMNGGVNSNGVIYKFNFTTVNVGETNSSIENIIFPNPSFGIFTFEQNTLSKTEIEIHNIIGELIYKTNTKTTQITIDLSKEAKGIYFVKTTDNNRNVTNKKIIIQ